MKGLGRQGTAGAGGRLPARNQRSFDPIGGSGLTVPMRASGIAKRATRHTFRYAFAAHLLEDAIDIRTRQELLAAPRIRPGRQWLVTGAPPRPGRP